MCGFPQRFPVFRSASGPGSAALEGWAGVFRGQCLAAGELYEQIRDLFCET